MTEHNKKKPFDCVAMMRKIRSQIYAGTENLTEEEFERWLQAQPIEDESLREWLDELEHKSGSTSDEER